MVDYASMLLTLVFMFILGVSASSEVDKEHAASVCRYRGVGIYPAPDGTWCCLCKSGTYLVDHCPHFTHRKPQDTVCQPCPFNPDIEQNQTFTSEENNQTMCSQAHGKDYCLQFQNSHRVTGTPKRDSTCECNEGFHSADPNHVHDGCHRHSPCKEGFEPRVAGNARNDTRCQKCSVGFFSNISSATEECIPHTKCGENRVITKGNSTHDYECDTASKKPESGQLDTGVIVAIIICVIFGVAAVLVCACCCLYKKGKICHRRSQDRHEQVVYIAGSAPAEDVRTMEQNGRNGAANGVPGRAVNLGNGANGLDCAGNIANGDFANVCDESDGSSQEDVDQDGSDLVDDVTPLSSHTEPSPDVATDGLLSSGDSTACELRVEIGEKDPLLENNTKSETTNACLPTPINREAYGHFAHKADLDRLEKEGCMDCCIQRQLQNPKLSEGILKTLIDKETEDIQPFICNFLSDTEISDIKATCTKPSLRRRKWVAEIIKKNGKGLMPKKIFKEAKDDLDTSIIDDMAEKFFNDVSRCQ